MFKSAESITLLHSSLKMLLLTALLMSATVSNSDSVSLPEPNTSFQPEEVVKIVIDALADNDHPYTDAGIETTFKFASPANKVNTGPLERFAKMVKGPVFSAMINHRRSEFSELVMRGDRAYQIVSLFTLDNTEVHFAFRLSQQTDGEFEGMWMTEAVWPLESSVEGIGV